MCTPIVATETAAARKVRVTRRISGMADPFYLRNRPPEPPRQPKTGERLFEFLRGHDRILCELYDLGDYGIDVRFWKNEEFWYSRRFDPRLDATRTPGELA